MSLSHDEFDADLFDDDDDDEIKPYRPGIIGTLIILLVLMSLLATLAWPLIPRGRPTPTPTPAFWEKIETASIDPPVTRIKKLRVTFVLQSHRSITVDVLATDAPITRHLH